jgi:hypothetical protein
MTKRGSSAMTATLAIDNMDVSHQRVVRQIGVRVGNPWIIQRNEGQATTRIPAGETGHLPPANPAVAVVDHNVRFWTLLGRRQSVIN